MFGRVLNTPLKGFYVISLLPHINEVTEYENIQVTPHIFSFSLLPCRIKYELKHFYRFLLIIC